jgi:ribose transport system substrate-binding protein
VKINGALPVVVTGALALALAACSDPAATSATSTSATSTSAASSTTSSLPASCSAKNPVIGVSLPNTMNPYYISMQKSFQDNGAADGFTIKVAIADNSDSNQLSQVQAFIQEHVCAVALNANNSGPAAADVKALNEAKIPVFTVNVIIDPTALKAQSASFVQYVGPDQTEGGVQMGQLALKALGANAKIVAGIVGDPDQIPTNERDAGFIKVLKADPDTTVLPTVNSQVDPNVSLQVTSELLQSNPNINVIFADTGPGATGAIQAIKQAGRGNRVKLYAFCAASTPLTGFYEACAAQEPAQYAQTLLKNVKSYLAGTSVPANMLQVTKVFTTGQTPGPGEVG